MTTEPDGTTVISNLNHPHTQLREYIQKDTALSLEERSVWNRFIEVMSQEQARMVLAEIQDQSTATSATEVLAQLERGQLGA